MKLSLRFKLFLGFITLNFVVSSLLGYFMYQSSSKRFFENFRNHKLSIARFLSTAIDGDIHERLTTVEASKTEPRFMEYVKLCNKTWKHEKEVQYIYTLNFDRVNDRLYYVLDGKIPEQDIMWFETPSFAFDYYVDATGRLTVEYNYSLFTEDFTIDTDIGAIQVGLKNGPGNKQLLIEGKPIFTLLTIDPLSASTPIGTATRADRVKSGPITIKGKEMECLITYSGK
nr:hypothetical protein [Spirochaetota bacterium]